MNGPELRAVDVHGHLGPPHGPTPLDAVENGSEAHLLRTMEAARIAASVVSSRYAIQPRGGGFCVEGNRRALRAVERLEGVFLWVTVSPLEPESLAQAADLLQHPKALGLKLHPAEHGYRLLERGDGPFALAAGRGVPLLGHSGEDGCMPEDYGFLADRYPEIPVIAAHLGHGYDGDVTHQIRAIAESRAGNLYTDTSGASSLLANLLEYAVAEIGAERILFGSDSGFYFSPSQRARVDWAAIDPADRRRILRDNALRLFPALRRLLPEDHNAVTEEHDGTNLHHLHL